MNPYQIEHEILQRAVSRVSLIGELDLVSENREGKSLGEWAHEVIDRVGENAQRAKSFKHFPAALAIWLTQHAQQPEVHAFWTGLPDWVQQGRLGPEYVTALQCLRLNDFQAALINSNRYVQAARIHALLPPFAIPDLFKKVRLAARNGWDAGDLRNHLLESQSTSAVSVRYLLEYAPEQADDLLDRMIKAVRLPGTARELLPSHIAAVAGGAKSIPVDSKGSSASNPRIHLDVLDYPTLEVILPAVPDAQWSLMGTPVSTSGKGCEKPAPIPPVVVQLDGSDPITLLPRDLPVLVFSNSGRYIKSGVLPKMGGVLVIDRSRHLKPDPYADLGRLRGDWGTHSAYVVTGIDYEVCDSDDVRVAFVTSRSDINVEEVLVPNVRFAGSQPVYSEVPRLLADRALVIDNATGIAVQRLSGDSVVDASHGPIVSLSIKGERLGDSYEIEGLVMRSARLTTTSTTLLPGRPTHAELTLPIGWSGPQTIELVHNGDRAVVVSDSTGHKYDLTIEVPSLSWAVHRRQAESPDWTAEALLREHADLPQIEGLRVYHGEATPPNVTVVAGGRPMQNLVPANQGISSTSSSHYYDLRSVHGLARTNVHETVEIRARLCGYDIVLMRFAAKAKKVQWKSVSLHDVASAAGYTEDEMRAARNANREAESVERRERDRLLTESLRRRSRGL